MTLHEAAGAAFRLSVDGYFNHEKYTYGKLYSELKQAFRGDNRRVIMEISLPDGWWCMSFNKYAYRVDGYDYYIPETREQEKRLKENISEKPQ